MVLEHQGVKTMQNKQTQPTHEAIYPDERKEQDISTKLKQMLAKMEKEADEKNNP